MMRLDWQLDDLGYIRILGLSAKAHITNEYPTASYHDKNILLFTEFDEFTEAINIKHWRHNIYIYIDYQIRKRHFLK